MHFEFNQPGELLTPTVNHGSVNRMNPFLSSCDMFSHDDFLTKDHSNDGTEQNQDFDLFSTFELPVLSDLDKTDLDMNDLELDKYISQSSFTPPAAEGNGALTSEESTFPWVGEECTVASQNIEDMLVPLSPSTMSESASSTISRQSTKKLSLSAGERKSRKKDQNKAAAEKYRLKKKTERSQLATRFTDLKHQNQELKFELQSMTNRLEQFKQLFVDILQIPVPTNETN